MDKLYSSGIIDQRVFTMFLGNNQSGSVETSKIWLGAYIGPENMNVTWLDITYKSYHWQVSLGKVIVNGVNYTPSATQAIFDSGTSLTYLPTKDFNFIMNQIMSKGI